MNKCINEQEYQPECPCEHCSSIFLEIKEYLLQRMSLTDFVSPSSFYFGYTGRHFSKMQLLLGLANLQPQTLERTFHKVPSVSNEPGYSECTLGFYTHLLTHFFTESFENYWAFVRTAKHN